MAVPPLSNSFISLVKDTSLAAVLTVPEIFQAAQRIAAVTYEPLILYTEAALIYLAFSSVLSACRSAWSGASASMPCFPRRIDDPPGKDRESLRRQSRPQESGCRHRRRQRDRADRPVRQRQEHAAALREPAETPDRGTLSIGPETVHFQPGQKLGREQVLRVRKQTGMVFQNFQLFRTRP